MDIFCFGFETLRTLLIAFVVLIITYLYTRREKGVPPGPNCWPFIGNLGSLVGKDTLNKIANLQSRYGDIYGIYFGSELNIFLNGYDIIHDVLVKRGSVFSARPTNLARKQDHFMIVFGNGTSWKELRKFSLQALRDLYFKKTGYTLEYRITDELEHLIKELSSFGDKEVNISHLITLSFANVIYSILHGRRIGYTDRKFNWYIDKLDEAFKVHVKTQTLKTCFPFLRYLPGDLLHEKYKEKTDEELIEYFNDISRPNYENYKPGDDNCLIDFWIKAENGSDIFRKENLWYILHDLMAAGSETTATTLKWIILAIIKYPNIQGQLQKNIDEVIGKEKTPSMSDRENLPYVEATVLEALRFGCPVPLSVPHAVLHDTILHGYKIPKEATIFPNIFSVHFDPKIFPEPFEFKPERFLNKEKTSITGTEKLIPFSLGPRSCLGETLARMELFLYVTTLLQKLEFQAPNNMESPLSLKGLFGLTHRPRDFKVIIRTRSRV